MIMCTCCTSGCYIKGSKMRQGKQHTWSFEQRTVDHIWQWLTHFLFRVCGRYNILLENILTLWRHPLPGTSPSSYMTDVYVQQVCSIQLYKRFTWLLCSPSKWNRCITHVHNWVWHKTTSEEQWPVTLYECWTSSSEATKPCTFKQL